VDLLGQAVGLLVVVAGCVHIAVGIAYDSGWVQGRLKTMDVAMRKRRDDGYRIDVLAPTRWFLGGRTRAVLYGAAIAILGVWMTGLS
jgi:hypothetical protein